VGKITARIRASPVQNLSCAGKVQLINSALLSMFTCWRQIFIPPKSGQSQSEMQIVWAPGLIRRGDSDIWGYVLSLSKKEGMDIKDRIKWNLQWSAS